MSEEIRREGELRDQDLENVSGGAHKVDDVQSNFCNKCVAKHSPSMCSGSVAQLAKYLDQHGGRPNTPQWQNCPFLRHY